MFIVLFRVALRAIRTAGAIARSILARTGSLQLLVTRHGISAVLALIA